MSPTTSGGSPNPPASEEVSSSRPTTELVRLFMLAVSGLLCKGFNFIWSLGRACSAS